MTFTIQYIIYAIYLLLIICIPCLKCFRSESNSETLTWNTRWIFLRKLFTSTASQLFS